MTTHGGKRLAGRKPYPDPATRKIQRAVTLAPETHAIITRNRRVDESYSATIDRLIQGSTEIQATPTKHEEGPP